MGKYKFKGKSYKDGSKVRAMCAERFQAFMANHNAGVKAAAEAEAEEHREAEDFAEAYLDKMRRALGI